MTDTFRALFAELRKEFASLYSDMSARIDFNDTYLERVDNLLERTAAALAQPEPGGRLPSRVGHILRLAEIIREVDGSHDKGAAALAEAILSHPGSRWSPTIEPQGPSDEVWDALKERLWHQYETCGYQGERFIYDSDFYTALDVVRQELARFGRPVIEMEN